MPGDRFPSTLWIPTNEDHGVDRIRTITHNHCPSQLGWGRGLMCRNLGVEFGEMFSIGAIQEFIGFASIETSEALLTCHDFCQSLHLSIFRLGRGRNDRLLDHISKDS